MLGLQAGPSVKVILGAGFRSLSGRAGRGVSAEALTSVGALSHG